MEKEMYSSALTFGLNDRLFLNCLDGINDEEARERISMHNNPFIWIATHTIWSRYNAIALLGIQAENPYKGMFENFRPIDDTMVFPSMEELKTEWKKTIALLKQALSDVSAVHLNADAPFKNPCGDFTIRGTIIFFAQHESYDIGQMAFLKKLITKEAMSYN